MLWKQLVFILSDFWFFLNFPLRGCVFLLIWSMFYILKIFFLSSNVANIFSQVAFKLWRFFF